MTEAHNVVQKENVKKGNSLEAGEGKTQKKGFEKGGGRGEAI